MNEDNKQKIQQHDITSVQFPMLHQMAAHPPDIECRAPAMTAVWTATYSAECIIVFVKMSCLGAFGGSH